MFIPFTDITTPKMSIKLLKFRTCFLATFLLCLLISKTVVEASCGTQYNTCKLPVPRDDLTCGESDADTFCKERVCTDPLFSTEDDCCAPSTDTRKGICCCGPFRDDALADYDSLLLSPGNENDPAQGGGGGDDVAPGPGDDAAAAAADPVDEYSDAPDNRVDCFETAWPNDNGPCDDETCRASCQSHGFGSPHDTCHQSGNYCCCNPKCARFLVSQNGCNEATCPAACLLRNFQSQDVNRCIDDRCCCRQQWV